MNWLQRMFGHHDKPIPSTAREMEQTQLTHDQTLRRVDRLLQVAETYKTVKVKRR